MKVTRKDKIPLTFKDIPEGGVFTVSEGEPLLKIQANDYINCVFPATGKVCYVLDSEPVTYYSNTELIIQK